MRKKLQRSAFSLTEILLAVGTLAIGMLFIAGTFLAGIYLTTVATEQTTAATVADEAFSKVRLYGLDLNHPQLATTSLVPFSALTPIPGNELMYPSTDAPVSRKQYYWTALCRKVSQNSNLVQVTVFVSRKVGVGTKYWSRQGEAGWPNLEQNAFPRPTLANAVQDPALHSRSELSIRDAVPADSIDERTFINDGYTIVDDRTGRVYRVLERKADQPDTVVLDRPWQGGPLGPPDGGWVWVPAPLVTGGRNPCITIYQKVIRF